MNTTKEIHGVMYYTGAHPKVRPHCRGNKRPTHFGNKIWATSLVVLDHFEKTQQELAGKRVLEIGCGWGLIGVYLAKRLRCRVTCSDIDENVLPIVHLHAELNDTAISTKRASFAQLDTDYLSNFSVIVGVEICYSEEVAQEIVEMIGRARKTNVSQILIADPGRPDFDTCKDYCAAHFRTDVTQLPGSVNGKTTQLLSAHLGASSF